MAMIELNAARLGVIGLGYVGLPLAVALSAAFDVVAFDIDPERVAALRNGVDRTGEVGPADLAAADRLRFSCDEADLSEVDVFIVAVPTPINGALQPDLTALERASQMVGRALRPGGVVIYESTVYPGMTEDVCVPILAQVSGLVFNESFFAGYSPERVNPGDRRHGFADIVKVTSGSTPEAADLVDAIYSRVVTAGTHKAPSIKVAEAAKVIENIQRDVNIALVNELAQLFKRMGLETRDILAAARTKWNFHPYLPGLVGGHCIGVDPYYLTHKAQSIGFHPEMILAGRRINDRMAGWVALDIVKAMLHRRIDVSAARVLVLGITFKEDCPDIRNTKIADLVAELQGVVGEVAVYDPEADAKDVERAYGLRLEPALPEGPFEAVVVAVGHRAFHDAGSARLRRLLGPNGLLYDMKQVFPVAESDARI